MRDALNASIALRTPDSTASKSGIAFCLSFLLFFWRRPRTRYHVQYRFSTADGKARRPSPEGDRSKNAQFDGLAQRRQVERAFAALEQDPQAFLDRLTKGDGIPQGIDTTEAAALTFRIGERLYQSGRWDLADKAFSLLLDRYPDVPLARWAVVWRLQYGASGALRAPHSLDTRSTPGCPALRPADRGTSFARFVRVARGTLSAGRGLSAAKSRRSSRAALCFGPSRRGPRRLVELRPRGALAGRPQGSAAAVACVLPGRERPPATGRPVGRTILEELCWLIAYDEIPLGDDPGLA